MILRAQALAALAALACATAAPAEAPRPGKATAPRPAARDWTKAVGETPDGGFRMGNPAAKVAIVEYGSLTCPHCRHFAQTGLTPLLERYVRSGRASYEFRSLILNGIDLAATLVARCSGPAHFFPLSEKLYMTQPAWTGRIEALSEADRKKLESMPQGQMMLEVARITGLIPMAAASGIAPGRAQACLTDKGAANRLVEMYRAAMDRGVRGTPTFLVNGKQIEGIDWSALEPKVRDALGERG